MSRIASMPIRVPPSVDVALEEGEILIKGPKGELQISIHSSVNVACEDGIVKCSPKEGVVDAVAQTGTARALIANMVTGVTDGFEKKLQLVGIGYRANMQSRILDLSLGFSHPIGYPCPEGVDIETPNQTEIIVRGVDKQRVGQAAAEIRAYRPPEPYKGKGIKYSDEIIVRKEAKKK